ncbi:sodium-dependent bicarbonate transport family permease [Rubrivivax sp. RP6-9]|uniref:sodium-dependent bicarbonate transport family permease n=1 Tax=Rubrivivax sp. RP6-9 TaxID=3415750 RepID=UPI003CC584C9
MQSFLDPAILFFVFGLLAGAVRSNLEIPPAISRFLSLYLLMALGLKGGFALAKSGLTAEVALGLGCAMLLAVVVPTLGWFWLKRRLNGFDAAALAATYGSVSAVTFITATQHLSQQGVAFGGHMAAAMALMESPAIVMAVLLATLVRRRQGTAAAAVGGGGAAQHTGLRQVLHEALTDGAQLLLIGAMVVGLLTGESGERAMQPFTGELFKGMLAFFLLDMGLLAARNAPALRGLPASLLGYAVLGPLLHASLALGLAVLVGLQAGDAALLMVLAASASYIAVPAVLREAIPEARPTLYFGLSLGMTFPFNILLGIPLYTAVARQVLGG